MKENGKYPTALVILVAFLSACATHPRSGYMVADPSLFKLEAPLQLRDKIEVGDVSTFKSMPSTRPPDNQKSNATEGAMGVVVGAAVIGLMIITGGSSATGISGKKKGNGKRSQNVLGPDIFEDALHDSLEKAHLLGKSSSSNYILNANIDGIDVPDADSNQMQIQVCSRVTYHLSEKTSGKLSRQFTIEARALPHKERSKQNIYRAVESAMQKNILSALAVFMRPN